MTTTTPRSIHEGRNIKRIREILGIKQDTLAMDLGLSQQAISQLEQKESIEKDLLDKVAKALRVSPEAIKNFNEENTYNYVNTFNDNSTGAFNNYNCTFNPLDKLLEVIEENKNLYERLLQSEREKIELLERSLK